MVPEELQPPRNRLSIAHLMLWTLGSAIILAGFRAFANQPQQDQGRLGTILSVFYLAYCLPLGAQVGSVAIWLLQRWRTERRFPTQPGHWLLLVEGISGLLSWLGYAAVFGAAQVFSLEAYGQGSLWLLAQIPPLTIALILYVRSWRSFREQGSLWSLANAALVLQHVVILAPVVLLVFSEWFLGPNLSDFHPYGPFEFQSRCCGPVSGLVVLVAGTSEFTSRAGSRDYLHWVGIAALVSLAALQFVLPIVVSWAMQM
jgi:hypothetical protein